MKNCLKPKELDVAISFLNPSDRVGENFNFEKPFWKISNITKFKTNAVFVLVY